MATTSPLMQQIEGRRQQRSSKHRQLTEDEEAEISFAWDKLAAGQAEVQARHVKMALRAMGFQVKKADMLELLQQHGLHEGQGVSFQAFTEVMTFKLQERSPQDEARRAFQLFDLQQSGRITLRDLQAIARQLQCDVEPQELEDMIAEFDQDGDGAINEEEFRAIISAQDG